MGKRVLVISILMVFFAVSAYAGAIDLRIVGGEVTVGSAPGLFNIHAWVAVAIVDSIPGWTTVATLKVDGSPYGDVRNFQGTLINTITGCSWGLDEECVDVPGCELYTMNSEPQLGTCATLPDSLWYLLGQCECEYVWQDHCHWADVPLMSGYELVVTIDPDDTVAEYYENNNEYVFPGAVPVEGRSWGKIKAIYR